MNSIPVTPSMERFTILCAKLEAACREFSLHPRRTEAHFAVFVNRFVGNNDCDEIGNWVDVAEFARESVTCKIVKSWKEI